MKQTGYVEIELVKNERSYKALLPIGASWEDAYQVLMEMADNVNEFRKQLEEQAKKMQEEKEKEEQQPKEELVPELVS